MKLVRQFSVAPEVRPSPGAGTGRALRRKCGRKRISELWTDRAGSRRGRNKRNSRGHCRSDRFRHWPAHGFLWRSPSGGVGFELGGFSSGGTLERFQVCLQFLLATFGFLGRFLRGLLEQLVGATGGLEPGLGQFGLFAGQVGFPAGLLRGCGQTDASGVCRFRFLRGFGFHVREGGTLEFIESMDACGLAKRRQALNCYICHRLARRIRGAVTPQSGGCEVNATALPDSVGACGGEPASVAESRAATDAAAVGGAGRLRVGRSSAAGIARTPSGRETILRFASRQSLVSSANGLVRGGILPGPCDKPSAAALQSGKLSHAGRAAR